jgi:hypothetical protein
MGERWLHAQPHYGGGEEDHVATTRLHQISWSHPKGDVVEVLCQCHKAQVLRALRALGIGCIGELAPAGEPCMRCAAEARGQDPVAYVGALLAGGTRRGSEGEEVRPDH